MLQSLLGIRVTLLIGPTLAVPAPEPLLEALSEIEVTLREKGRNGFELTFTLGRGPADVIDYALVALPLLRPFNRVVIQVWMGVTPEVLIDGFITHHEVRPSNEPGASRFFVKGQDVRVMMAMQETSMFYLGLSPDLRVRQILTKYLLYFASPPTVLPPVPMVAPSLSQVPAQSETDLHYVERLARQVGYVFYVEPGPAPMVNQVFWGLENRLGSPQPPLSMNMGPASNIDQLTFAYDALEPEMVIGSIQETQLGAILPVASMPPIQVPLAPMPVMAAQAPNVRTVQMCGGGNLSYAQAQAQANAMATNSSNAVKARGELEAVTYGSLLRANRTVSVRGSGAMYDGFWFVHEVTHRISKGNYRQSFELRREGLGPLSPVVPVI